MELSLERIAAQEPIGPRPVCSPSARSPQVSFVIRRLRADRTTRHQSWPMTWSAPLTTVAQQAFTGG